ncbi:sensor histidine kinase [Pontibacter liquoris]|uniref:sensor histidine kinase n=1 Tax=Pontibacter liquoris TaxID=2905677 RepID=UPI001FA7056E|nr:PAS domain S-box protein [Pontibacter liquoris]
MTLLSPKFYSSIVRNSNDMFSVIGCDGVYRYVGNSVKAILGFDAEELLGKSAFDYIHPDDIAPAMAAFESVSGEKPLQIPPFRFRNKAGNWRWLQCSITYLVDDEDVQGIVSNAKDITEKIEAEFVKEHQQAYYQSLFFEHPDTVFTLQPDGCFQRVNKHISKLTGYPEEAVIGSSFTRFLLPQDLQGAEEAFTKALSGEANNLETRIIDAKGIKKYISVSLMPVYFRGVVEGVQGIAKDITEKKAAAAEQKKLAEELLKQNIDLQQFTYVISHNLRAPVANALGLARLLKKLDKQAPVYDQCLAKVETSIQQLDTVIKDLNQVLSLRDNNCHPSQEDVNLLQVCQEVLYSFESRLQALQAQVTLAVAPTLALPSSKAYLYSILYNLVSNAIKFRSPDRPLQLILSAEKDSQGYVLTVSDNGLGMEMAAVEDQLFKLYKRFHLHTPGKGIGLFMVKTQAEALGGNVSVESALHVGTTFSVYLPAHV